MKNTIRINESQLKAIIVESVKKCLKEYRERKSYDRNRDQVSAKLAQRRKVSQKDWDRYISSDRSRPERNYSDWLTSRNNYYRG